MQKKNNFLNHTNLKRIILILILFCFSSIIFSKEIHFGKEKYFIDLPSSRYEHSGVVDTYKNIIKGNTLYNNILSPTNKKEFSKGTISVNEWIPLTKLKIQHLNVKENNKQVYYGSEVDNEFKCKESICEFYGWLGDDEYKIDDDTTNYIIKDFIKNVKNNKTKNSEDKILIDDNYDGIEVRTRNNQTVLFVLYDRVWRYVILDAISDSEVKNWLKIAKGQLYDEDNKYNPIKIE